MPDENLMKYTLLLLISAFNIDHKKILVEQEKK